MPSDMEKVLTEEIWTKQYSFAVSNLSVSLSISPVPTGALTDSGFTTEGGVRQRGGEREESECGGRGWGRQK